MTKEEAIYWKGYIDRQLTEKLERLTGVQVDSAKISGFADSYMRTVVGQEYLSQGLFREFLKIFAGIPEIQKSIVEHQEQYNEWIHTVNEYIDLRVSELVAPSAQKEVYSILTASDTAPEDANDGDLYINTDEHVMYKYNDEDGEWQAEENVIDAVYITGDTSHLYIYDVAEGIYKDVTGQNIDNTIYVTDLVEDLKPYYEDGIYSVCYTIAQTRYRNVTEWYTMYVKHETVRGRQLIGRPTTTTTVYTQTLQNKDGYQIRTGTQVNDGEIRWQSWQKYAYSFESRNSVRPLIDIAFRNGTMSSPVKERGGKILIRDKNNAIKDDDYIILYYWDRKNRRMAAFAGGHVGSTIMPVTWESMEETSTRKKKGWKDDWRELPYSIADIIKRITKLDASELDDLTWEGGYLKKSLLGSMSFVGGPKGNGYGTKLWIGIARGVNFQRRTVNDEVRLEHFTINELMHRIPFHIRFYHVPDVENEEYVEGEVKYCGSHSRKPHLDFQGELDSWGVTEEEIVE